MTDLARIGVVVVVVEVLIGVTQFGTKEADGPRDLYPQHEQRQGGKWTVDGIVAGEEYLRMDIEYLQSLHGETCQNAWE